MSIKFIDEIEASKGKQVLLRVDFNVPIKDGYILDNTRIVRSLSTIKMLLEKCHNIVIISHLGRPKGSPRPELSLEICAEELAKLLPKIKVKFLDNLDNYHKPDRDEILVLENIRFHPEEEKNDESFAKRLARFGDIYVNDAFACSHRDHASITGLPRYLPTYGGLLIKEELENLECTKTVTNKIAAIIGGSKVSSKLSLLYGLVEKCDSLIIIGAMANNFIEKKVGKSLIESSMKSEVSNILAFAEKCNCEIVLPEDFILTRSLESDDFRQSNLEDIDDDELIADIAPSPANINKYIKHLERADVIIWNGPAGAYEYEQYSVGSKAIIDIISKLENKKIIAGGGDTVAMIERFNKKPVFTYISTAGGAFLEWIQGVELPGIIALDKESVCV